MTPPLRRSLFILMVAIRVSPVMLGAQQPAGQPVLVTDRTDYSPGDTVTLTGKHVTPLGSYRVAITLPDGRTTHTVSATANDNGNFTTTYVLDGQQGDHHAVLYDALGNELADTHFHDSHFRYGHLTWRQTGTRTAEFTLVNAFRRGDYPGSGADGRVVTGDIFDEFIGPTRLCFGDGACTTGLRYEAISYDVAQDWVIGRAIFGGDVAVLAGMDVTVAEVEPNDATGTANSIALGDDFAGSVSPSSETDVVRFTVGATTQISATALLGSLVDSYLYLYDAGGNRIAEDDDSGPGLGSLITRNLGPGTYFLAIQSFDGAFSGSYTLQLRAAAVVPSGPVMHTYPTAGPFTAFIDTCCRIALENFNNFYRVESTLRFDIPDSSPVSGLPPIVNAPVNTPAFSFLLPAADAEGDTLSFRLATQSESQIFNPIGPAWVPDAPNPLSVDSSTGLVSWNTNGTVLDGLYTTQIVVEERRQENVIGKSAVDFILRIVDTTSTPPTCELSPPTTAYTVSPGQSVGFTVSGLDVDAGDTIMLNTGGLPSGASMAPALPVSGATSVSSVFNWTPGAGTAGAAHVVTYTVADPSGLTAQCAVTINVSANRPPSATVDAYTTGEDAPLHIAVPGVLGNDTDADGNTLRVVDPGSVAVAHGTLTLNANGSFSYTPNVNFNGPDSFTYKANDGTLDSNTVTVTITVNAVNDAPVGADDTYATDEDIPLTVSAAGVLDNDTDVDSASLSAVLVSGPASGMLTLNADGSFSYAPNGNFNGTDGFSYRASDVTDHSDVTAVTITVNPVNDAPVAEAGGPYTVDEGASVVVSAAATDAEGGPLTFEWDLDNDGTFETPGQTVTFSALRLDGPSSTSISVRAVDDGALSGGASATVNVLNVAPAVGAITAPATPQLIGSPVSISTGFSDPGTQDAFTCSINWGDGGVTTGTIAAGACSASRPYSAAGVYTLEVTVTDDDTGSGFSTFSYVVVYDGGAFVTGSGWVSTPGGALTANPALAGRSNFGFNARVRGSRAEGRTEFQFQDGRLDFHSSSYDWLVVSSASALYVGSGTINGSGDYGFLVSVVDGKEAGDRVHRFRIRIWDKATGTVVYDNEPGADLYGVATRPVGGGTVVIH